MQASIERVTAGRDLPFEEARSVVAQAVDGATEAQLGALLAGLRAKGETEHEIAGFAAGLRAQALRIDPDVSPVVDTCGTGGDRHDTINVSTTSAIVAAGAGVAVAKHGNYAVSSDSGSADVFAELGVHIDLEPPAVERAIEADGIGFLLAPTFHPAMAAVADARSQLGIRTIFNILGPLTNPAGADAQLIGVYDPDLVPVIAEAVTRLPTDRALVVHGSGLDEVAIHGETAVAEVRGGRVDRYRLGPADLGLERAPVSAVAGGPPSANAADLEAIVEGTDAGPKRDIVLANAGAALYAAEAVPSIPEGVAAARDAIASGAAAEKLAALRRRPTRP